MKRGISTSEFWITFLMIVGIVAGEFAGLINGRYAAIATALSASAYAISRGLAKKGGAQ